MNKDYSAEFKRRFADGVTITMLQREFGLTKSTVRLWREKIDQGCVETKDGPRKNNRCPRNSSFASPKPICVARATTNPTLVCWCSFLVSTNKARLSTDSAGLPIRFF